VISFYVLGVPRPQGSKRAFIAGGRARLVEQCRHSRPWRESVKLAAYEAADGTTFGKGASLWVDLEFVFVRPKSHTTPKGKLRLSAPQNHTQRPDLDKLTRCVLDGLTQAGVMHDDSQVTQLSVAKMWGEIAGCTVEIRKAGA